MPPGGPALNLTPSAPPGHAPATRVGAPANPGTGHIPNPAGPMGGRATKLPAAAPTPGAPAPPRWPAASARRTADSAIPAARRARPRPRPPAGRAPLPKAPAGPPAPAIAAGGTPCAPSPAGGPQRRLLGRASEVGNQRALRAGLEGAARQQSLQGQALQIPALPGHQTLQGSRRRSLQRAPGSAAPVQVGPVGCLRLAQGQVRPMACLDRALCAVRVRPSPEPPSGMRSRAPVQPLLYRLPRKPWLWLRLLDRPRGFARPLSLDASSALLFTSR